MIDSCCDCGRPVTEQEVSYLFGYGIAPNTVYLRVTHIGWQCTSDTCDSIITDWRGEEARENAVKEHLNGSANG